MLLASLYNLKGEDVERGCRGCDKFRAADSQSLKRQVECYICCNGDSLSVTVRSGTNEEYTELMQLLEDVSTYQRDMQSAILQHKQEKKPKEMSDKSIGEEMTKAAMETLSRKFSAAAFIFHYQKVFVQV